MSRFSFPLSLLACVTALAVSCSRPVSTPPAPAATPAAVPAEIVQWSGQRGGTDIPGTRILRTAADWTTFWREVGREAPQSWIENGDMTVAIFLGQKRTAGYSAKVIGSHVENARLVVDYRETAPAPGALVAQILTAPWVVARLPRSDLPIVARALSEPGQK